MKIAYDIIRRPVLTEKGYQGIGEKKYVFEVAVDANKVEIKNAQVLVNGQPVLFKGANRHELDPVTGYVVSMDRMLGIR